MHWIWTRSCPSAKTLLAEKLIDPAAVVFAEAGDGVPPIIDAVVAAVAVAVVQKRLKLQHHVAVGRPQRDRNVGQRRSLAIWSIIGQAGGDNNDDPSDTTSPNGAPRNGFAPGACRSRIADSVLSPPVHFF